MLVLVLDLGLGLVAPVLVLVLELFVLASDTLLQTLFLLNEMDMCVKENEKNIMNIIMNVVTQCNKHFHLSSAWTCTCSWP